MIKMVESGQVLSQDFMAPFAKEIRQNVRERKIPIKQCFGKKAIVAHVSILASHDAPHIDSRSSIGNLRLHFLLLGASTPVELWCEQ